MAFGQFTLTGTFQALGGTPATGRVTIDGNPQVVIDSAGDKFRVGPRTVTLDTSGSFSITLPSDATTGNSTGIAFRVTVNLKHQNLPPINLYARPIGSTVDLADITSQAIPELTVLPAGPPGPALPADQMASLAVTIAADVNAAVAPAVATALAADPTPANAAAAAVGTAITAQNLVRGTDARLPQPIPDDPTWDSIETDSNGVVMAGRRTDGSRFFYKLDSPSILKHGTASQVADLNDPLWDWVDVDTNGVVVEGAKTDGTRYIGKLDSPILTPTAPADVATGHFGGYNRESNCYRNRSSQKRRFRAKFGGALASAGHCRIATLGDSQTWGVGLATAADLPTKAYPMQMRSVIAALTGVPIAGTGLVLAEGVGSANRDPRWTGTSAHLAGSFNAAVTLTTGQTATFASDLPGTIVEVLYHGQSAAFTITVDGGAAVNVTPTGTDVMTLHTITGLSDATHTVVIGGVSTGTARITAAGVRRATGLTVSNFGLPGTTSGQWLTTGAAYQPLASAVAYAADLNIVMIGTNDELQAVGAATFATNLASIVSQLKAVGDVAIVAPIPFSGNSGTYRPGLFDVADTYDVPVLDLYDRWGSYATANGFGQMFDVWHPNAIGYGDIALAATKLIGL